MEIIDPTLEKIDNDLLPKGCGIFSPLNLSYFGFRIVVNKAYGQLVVVSGAEFGNIGLTQILLLHQMSLWHYEIISHSISIGADLVHTLGCVNGRQCTNFSLGNYRKVGCVIQDVESWTQR